MLAGLWRLDSGQIIKPMKLGHGGLLFVPQRPYITRGTLRQQVLYPENGPLDADSDTKFREILAAVDLAYLAQQWSPFALLLFSLIIECRGLDQTVEWSNLLSGALFFV